MRPKVLFGRWNTEAERVKKAAKKVVDRKYKHCLQPHDLGPPEFGNNSGIKNREWEKNSKKRRKMELKIFTQD